MKQSNNKLTEHVSFLVDLLDERQLEEYTVWCNEYDYENNI